MPRKRMKIWPKSGRQRKSKSHMLLTLLFYFFLSPVWSIKYQKVLVAAAGIGWAGHNGERLKIVRSAHKACLGRGRKPAFHDER
jgi:hypothetical protein